MLRAHCSLRGSTSSGTRSHGTGSTIRRLPSSRSWGSNIYVGGLEPCFAYGMWHWWADAAEATPPQGLVEPIIEDAVFGGGRGADLLQAWTACPGQPLSSFVHEDSDALAAISVAINAAGPQAGLWPAWFAPGGARSRSGQGRGVAKGCEEGAADAGEGRLRQLGAAVVGPPPGRGGPPEARARRSWPGST